MIFLADQQLPLALARWITSEGHQTFHVRELRMEHAEDLDIWAEAQRRNATIISKDADFIGISRLQPGQPVVWIRFGNCSNVVLLQRFKSLWPRVRAELQTGAMLVEVQ